MTFRVLGRDVDDELWSIPSGRAPLAGRNRTRLSLKASMCRGGRHRGAPHQARARIHVPRSWTETRKVVVKARIVRASRRGANSAHLRYLEREGVELGGGAGELYDRAGRAGRVEADQPIDAEKHQFRLIVSPEDGHELDLHGYVRELMRRVERDLGRQLRWVAVNHHNTDNPHAHVVVRGVDAQGNEVRLPRQYVSHGLRGRAQELATELLGPRPERTRQADLDRQVGLVRYTGLDARLERLADAERLVELRGRRFRDTAEQPALGRRLETLRQMGLATRGEDGRWRLEPTLRESLQKLERREESLKVLERVVSLAPTHCHVVDAKDSRSALPKELLESARGVVRWKGLDEAGAYTVVVETGRGHAYHLPVRERAFQALRVGHAVDIGESKDKDERIREIAAEDKGLFDVEKLSELRQRPYARRLEQLERMGLADRVPAKGPRVWRVALDLTQRVAETTAERQRGWQWLSVRGVEQKLEEQQGYRGHVWLDRISRAERENLSSTGYGAQLRAALEQRHAYVRSVGLDPDDTELRWKFRDLQRGYLEEALANRTGKTGRAGGSVVGLLRMRVARNGERFAEIEGERTVGVFAVSRETHRQARELQGKAVRASLDNKRRTQLVARVLERGRGGPEL